MSDDRPPAQPGATAGDAEPDRRPTFSDVLAVGEFRALFFSTVVSWIGDYLARAAIIVLVYQESQSVSLSAASFAISYLPWILGGPVLSAIAERYPYKRVLITADLARAVPIALIALPGVPVPLILILLFVAMLGGPPTQATVSALIPQVLERRLLVTGLALQSSMLQGTQVFGYLIGATLAASLNPRVGLALDAVSFLVSALIIASGIKPRPAANDGAERRHLLRETGEGFQVVFGTPALRAIAIMVFALTTFTILPEGLAAGWAALFERDAEAAGFDQGLIMAAGPIGYVIGGIIIGRTGSAEAKQRLVRPLAVLAPLCLALTAFAPNAVSVAVLVAGSGFAQGMLLPTLNGAFVLALPHGYRARAFGVMAGGTQLTQGGAVLATGVLAQFSSIPVVVGLWSLAGLVLMVTLAARQSRRIKVPAVTGTPEHGKHAAPDPPAPAGPPAPRQEDPSVPRRPAHGVPEGQGDHRQGGSEGYRPRHSGPDMGAMHITPAPGRRTAAGRLEA
ncbi:MFS transporter [Actinoplanes sp. RD1]|uniref:MFS transporter n=1 Tax=Actinoplanes sp. RD1 TaxID=3064538 RepID=UPI0027405E49|nr:MFS transporter [Actinoplanes sp. RD1]